MVSKEYPRIGEKIYHAELPNGLHIYVDRRPEFQKSYAFFATNYGGMDMKFRLDGQWRDTPAGVAHFLEHKMFDTEDGNALQDLAANGASPNAFTSSALTGYYFESTEKFCDNLKILLSFVSIPWFTQESVDKEQGIIGQEIRMVEDDPDINRLLCRILTDGGYDVRPAFSGSEAVLWAEQYEYDLVLLDLMLPGLTGEEFIAEMRQKKTMPIIVLSAKAGLEDRVNVLRLGADDFIPKPFDNAEVLARVEAQLRRYKQFSGGGGSAVLTHGDLTLDREGVTVTAAGKPVTVTAREFDILTLLMEHPKKVFTREQLYEQVWGGEYMGDDNTVNVHISNLRAKLAKASPAEYIKTVWGIGFKMSDL